MRFVFACFVSLIVLSAHAEEHLTPLDARGVDLYQGFRQFLVTVYPKQNNALAEIYIWPSFKAGEYIAILQSEDESNYYLLYAQNTKPTPAVAQIALTADFSKEFSAKLAEIIQHNTRYYENPLESIECTDGTEFVFESNQYYGRAYCLREKSAVPYQLALISDELIEMAETSTGNPEKQQQLIRAILKNLNDVKPSSSHGD